MNSESRHSEREAEVRALYFALLDGWNRRDASAYAALMAEDASLVGFDGSQMNGRADIEATISAIFADHPTARYVGIVREVRFLSDEVALLRAVCGMIPVGQRGLNPALNAIQTLIAVRGGGAWKIALFQNTPAEFHGRPELVQQLTEELREAL